ncbi:hypothetical protein GCM10023148_30460 [Actinokineospora soli]
MDTGLPAAVVAAVAAALLCELIWRFDLRPRALWNGGGLTLVQPFAVDVVRWGAIGSVAVSGNTVRVTASDGTPHEWEFDRYWWLARFSSAYAERSDVLEARLVDALEKGRGEGDVHRPPSGIPRRPLAFLLLVAGSAVAGHFVVPLMG